MTGLFDDRSESGSKQLRVRDPTIFKQDRELPESDVNAVVIPTPGFPRPEHFEAAVQTKKHICIEKPAAVGVAIDLKWEVM